MSTIFTSPLFAPAIINIGMQAASGVYATFAGAVSTKAEKIRGEYNSRIHSNNAAIFRREASYALAQGARNEAQIGRETGQFIGAQHASQGASGVSDSSKSFLDARMDTAAHGARRAVAERDEAKNVAWKAETEAQNNKIAARQALAARPSMGQSIFGGILNTAPGMGMAFFTAYNSGAFAMAPKASPSASTASTTSTMRTWGGEGRAS